RSHAVNDACQRRQNSATFGASHGRRMFSGGSSPASWPSPIATLLHPASSSVRRSVTSPTKSHRRKRPTASPPVGNTSVLTSARNAGASVNSSQLSAMRPTAGGTTAGASVADWPERREAKAPATPRDRPAALGTQVASSVALLKLISYAADRRRGASRLPLRAFLASLPSSPAIATSRSRSTFPVA